MTERMTILTGITDRPLMGESDAMRLRQLLIDSYAMLGREFNWETRRWEGTFWHRFDAEPDYSQHSPDTHIWENDTGQLVGAVVLDGPGDIALQIHPDCRQLEETMLIWAEENLARTNDVGERELSAWVFDWDKQRQALLTKRGYAPDKDVFYMHRRRAISDPVPDLDLVEGYTLRGLQPVEADTVGWVTATNAVFGHTHTPDFVRSFQQNSPSHNYDLHVIAEAPTGEVAAFAGLTVDAVNRYATFEPVGTHPDHRRKGLARLAMVEGLRRLQALGTVDVAYVANWGTAPAGKFYAACGFAHYATNQAWVKKF